jgi:predicted dehydrogenase
MPIGSIRLGVLGAGWFASRRHLPDAQKDPRIEIAALCRRDTESRQRLAAHFQVPEEQTFADWEEMLERARLDILLIATPNALHYHQAKTALECGVHVLVEKPMTLRSEEAWELVRLAKERGLLLSTTLNPPYWAHAHAMRHALEAGTLGELEAVSMLWTGSAESLFGKTPLPETMPGLVRPSLYRADAELNGGGFFIDAGTHHVSELLWVTQRRVRKVTALFDSHPSDMRASVAFEMEGGVFAQMTQLGDSHFPERRLQHLFLGSEGSMAVNGGAFQTTILPQNAPPQTFTEAELPPVSNPISNFANALEGKETLHSPQEHGAEVVQVVEAISRSVQTGKTVLLDS